MTAQDVVNAVSIDVRQTLANSSTDATTILGWVDRTHKDVLHSSLYINQNLATTSLTTVSGTTSYTLTPPSSIRRVVSVYDTTFNKPLYPSDLFSNPSPEAARVQESKGESFLPMVTPPKLGVFSYAGTPEYYRFIAPTTMLITPAGISSAYNATLNVVYEVQVATVNALGTTLIVPNDGLDVMVAGTNWMAFAFLQRPQESQQWFQVYTDLKMGHRTGSIK